MADLDDLNNALDRINMIAADLNSKADDVLDRLDDVVKAVEDLGDVSSGGGGGPASGASKGGGSGASKGRPGKNAKGGGGLDSLLGLAKRHPAAAAISAIAAPIGAAAGQGLVSSARGGEFTAGFEQSINRTVGKIPVIGEVTGIAGANRIEEATTKRIGQAIGAIEAIAGSGSITPDVEQFLLKEVSGQEERRESAQERIRMRSQEYFRDHPEARGNRSRLTGQDVMQGLMMGAGAPMWRRMMESNGLGTHK